MKQIACLGTETFTLGFKLAGISKTVVVSTDGKDSKSRILENIYNLKQDKNIGIVVLDESLLRMVDGPERSEIEDSVSPVFISLSTETSSDSIRKLIIKSIGVDLMKE